MPDMQLSGLGGRAPDVLSVRIRQILYVRHGGELLFEQHSGRSLPPCLLSIVDIYLWSKELGRFSC